MRRHYAGVPTREQLLHQAVSSALSPSSALLDAGCGSDFPLLSRYASSVAVAIGLDLCRPTVRPQANVYPLVGSLDQIPCRSESIDVIMSRSVLEHLENPESVFKELHRVLRPGGKVIFTTPNKYYYSCLVAKVFPDWARNIYFKRVFGEEDYDRFPVYYRANTVAAFTHIAEATHFRVLRIQAIRHFPYYLMFSTLLFRLGILYDQVITALGLHALQSNWLVVMEKEL